MKKYFVMCLAACGILLVSLSATALPGFAPGPRGWDPLDRIGMMAERIGADESQLTQVQALVNAAQLETAVDRERSHQIHRELQSLASHFHSTTAHALSQELGEITARLAYNRASTFAQVRELLTSEQLEVLDELKSRRAALHSTTR